MFGPHPPKLTKTYSIPQNLIMTYMARPLPTVVVHFADNEPDDGILQQQMIDKGVTVYSIYCPGTKCTPDIQVRKQKLVARIKGVEDVEAWNFVLPLGEPVPLQQLELSMKQAFSLGPKDQLGIVVTCPTHSRLTPVVQMVFDKIFMPHAQEYKAQAYYPVYPVMEILMYSGNFNIKGGLVDGVTAPYNITLFQELLRLQSLFGEKIAITDIARYPIFEASDRKEAETTTGSLSDLVDLSNTTASILHALKTLGVSFNMPFLNPRKIWVFYDKLQLHFRLELERLYAQFQKDLSELHYYEYTSYIRTVFVHTHTSALESRLQLQKMRESKISLPYVKPHKYGVLQGYQKFAVAFAAADVFVWPTRQALVLQPDAFVRVTGVLQAGGPFVKFTPLTRASSGMDMLIVERVLPTAHCDFDRYLQNLKTSVAAALGIFEEPQPCADVLA